MPKVMITPHVFYRTPGPYVRMLEDAGFEVCYPSHPNLATEEEMLSELPGMSAVIAGGGEPFTPKVLAGLPEMRVVARAGVGYDKVDVPACTERNIAVTITPTANHECVAEHTLALLLSLTRVIVPHHHDVLAGDWTRKLMVPLRGRTLGLIGLGRIGRSVAVRAHAFRLKLVACEKFPDRDFVERYGVELVDLPTLLSRSDYVSLHVPLGPETRGLMNRETFRQMKPGSMLVNTARGGLVVEADLLEALKSGHLGGAGLDVFEQEPTPVENPLLKLPNVVTSPHVGGGDTQSNEDMAVESAQNIITLARGGWPKGAVVNDALEGKFKWKQA